MLQRNEEGILMNSENRPHPLGMTRLWTAVVTPMHADGEIDFESFEKLLQEQVDAGNGVVVLGSTGEALNLSQTEKVRVLEFTNNLALKTPVMIGVGGHHLESTLEWIDQLESLQNIDSYLVVTPLYAKPGTEGQYHWFKSILDRSTRPCMLYNVPGRTGVEMSTEAVLRLNSHPQFWAIKEASGSVEKFCEYRNQLNGQLLYSGDDALTPDFAPHGCHGLISVAGNVWPKETNQFVELTLKSELTLEEVGLWKRASLTLFNAANPIPTKALLFATGRIGCAQLKAPLHMEDLSDMAPLEQANQSIVEWYNLRSEGSRSNIGLRLA